MTTMVIIIIVLLMMGYLQTGALLRSRLRPLSGFLHFSQLSIIVTMVRMRRGRMMMKRRRMRKQCCINLGGDANISCSCIELSVK